MDFFLSLPVPNHTADTNYTYIVQYASESGKEKSHGDRKKSIFPVPMVPFTVTALLP